MRLLITPLLSLGVAFGQTPEPKSLSAAGHVIWSTQDRTGSLLDDSLVEGTRIRTHGYARSKPWAW